MNCDNPLVLAVLNVLKKSDEAFSLYQLMNILEKSGYVLFEKADDLTNEMILFRKNFVVMNALYQLKTDLIFTGYQLLISSLKIQIIPQKSQYNSNDTISLDDDILTHKALSEYYLDWQNYHLTDQDDINDLLNSFWNNYSDYNQRHNAKDKRLDSLQVLGLESTASWKDIQQTYRQLVTVYHPDKGGNSLNFIRIREAYLVLKLTLNSSQ